MKILSKVLCSLLLLIVLSSGVIYADSFVITIADPDATIMAKLINDETTGLRHNRSFELIPRGNLGDNITEFDLLTVSEDGRRITFNQAAFAVGTETSRRDAVKLLVDTLKLSDMSPQTQQSIFQQLGSFDKDISVLFVPLIFEQTNADLFSAFRVVAPFLPLVRVILGVMSVVIVFLLMISTVLDLAYIGLPFAREISVSSSDGRGGSNKTTSKPPGVSWDAIVSVQETETSLGKEGGYKNAYVTYFRRRVLTYIILSICILYLVVGELGGLIAALLNLASGVVR